VPKNILVVSPDYFKQKFLSPLTKSNVIGMDDVKMVVLKDLLRFLHSGTLDGMDKFLPDLFIVANNYLIDNLKASLMSL
jgi:hypothetical protein